MAQVFSAHPEAITEHARHRRALQGVAQARRADAPELPRARGLRHRGLLPARRARRASSARFDELAAQGKNGRPRGVPQAPRDRARRHREDEVPRATSSSSGTSSATRRRTASRWARGAARAPARIVAYAMRITDLDPIPYNLLFERFLNPERVSMPDFDVDFCMDRRDEVIAYVQKKYGEHSVGQIATFAELKSKSVVKDVARCIGITPVEAQGIANLIPRKTPGRDVHHRRVARASSPSSRRAVRQRPRIKELLDQARKLEGLTRHAGKHAAGIVISEGPLWDHVPVFKDDKTGALVTQYYKDDVEQAGLVKFDFLGLKTLTVLDIASASSTRGPTSPRAGTRSSTSPRIPLDDARDLQAPRLGRDQGRLPARVRRDAAALQGPQARQLRGHRRRRRALPPGPAGRRHARGLRAAASTAGAHRVDAPAHRRAS